MANFFTYVEDSSVEHVYGTRIAPKMMPVENSSLSFVLPKRH